jgi:hypothetical protein
MTIEKRETKAEVDRLHAASGADYREARPRRGLFVYVLWVIMKCILFHLFSV